MCVKKGPERPLFRVVARKRWLSCQGMRDAAKTSLPDDPPRGASCRQVGAVTCPGQRSKISRRGLGGSALRNPPLRSGDSGYRSPCTLLSWAPVSSCPTGRSPFLRPTKACRRGLDAARGRGPCAGPSPRQPAGVRGEHPSACATSLGTFSVCSPADHRSGNSAAPGDVQGVHRALTAGDAACGQDPVRTGSLRSAQPGGQSHAPADGGGNPSGAALRPRGRGSDRRVDQRISTGSGSRIRDGGHEAPRTHHPCRRGCFPQQEALVQAHLSLSGDA